MEKISAISQLVSTYEKNLNNIYCVYYKNGGAAWLRSDEVVKILDPTLSLEIDIEYENINSFRLEIIYED